MNPQIMELSPCQWQNLIRKIIKGEGGSCWCQRLYPRAGLTVPAADQPKDTGCITGAGVSSQMAQHPKKALLTRVPTRQRCTRDRLVQPDQGEPVAVADGYRRQRHLRILQGLQCHLPYLPGIPAGQLRHLVEIEVCEQRVQVSQPGNAAARDPKAILGEKDVCFPGEASHSFGQIRHRQGPLTPPPVVTSGQGNAARLLGRMEPKRMGLRGIP